MLNHSRESTGRLIARTLAGSWRTVPNQIQLESEELASITPLLLPAGAAGLAWRRLRGSQLEDTAFAAELRSQYQRNTVLAVLQQQRIESLFRSLDSSGIQPLLVKGWAAARLYGDEGLRPYVDVDICVERRQLAGAESALKALANNELNVDLHREFETLGGGSYKEIYARAETIDPDGVTVRVPCAEDHLRVLAIHMLREGAWRPLWLCDVAAAVESRPATFSWDICLGRNRQWSNWVICALKLAEEMLGAKINGTPAAGEKPLPQSLVRTVLNEWGSPAPSMSLRHQSPMAGAFRSRAALTAGFRNRWPNAIEGTVVSGGLFNNLPRLPFQFGAYLKRGAQFALGLSRLRREH